jgi:NhaP-type Na+/H+ or K+/H+ antiporter
MSQARFTEFMTLPRDALHDPPTDTRQVFNFHVHLNRADNEQCRTTCDWHVGAHPDTAVATSGRSENVADKGCPDFGAHVCSPKCPIAVERTASSRLNAAGPKSLLSALMPGQTSAIFQKASIEDLLLDPKHMSALPSFGLESYHIALACLGGIVILANWLPRLVTRRDPAASGLLILLGMAGYAFVPGLPAIPDPRTAPYAWEVVSELCVIAALFATGLSIDKLRDWRIWSATVRLLMIAMPITILAVALLGHVVAGLTIAGALLLGAVMAPTDPVLAGDVQVGPPLEGGEHPVRFALTTEAGLNDGLAFPFVYLALLVAAEGLAPQAWLVEWLAIDVAWRIAVGTVMGAAGGWALGQVLFVVPRGAVLADTATGVVALAGILLCYGTTELVEGYGFIAVAVAGLVLRRVEAEHKFHRRLHHFTEAIEHSLTAVLLVALGAVLPMLLADLTLGLAGIAVALLFVVRPLVGWLSLAGSTLTGRDRWVVAIYGVRGIGSIYYLAYAAGKVEFFDEDPLWALVGFTILLSAIAHGFTAGIAMAGLKGNKSG